MSEDASSVISKLNSINIDHGNNDPMNFFRKLDFVDCPKESFHHPWSNSLSGMLSCNSYSNYLSIGLFIERQVRNLISKNCLSDYEPSRIFKLSKWSFQSIISVGWLTTKVDFILIMLKLKTECQVEIISFNILLELHLVLYLHKLLIFFFFRQIKRF